MLGRKRGAGLESTRAGTLTTISPGLPPRAIIKDKETWIGEDVLKLDRARKKE